MGSPVPNRKLTAQNAYLTEMLRQAGLDAQAQRVAAQIQAVLIDEIHHRMKNMLGMVSAIVRQSMRSASSITAAEAAIGTRLVAMAKAHDLLLKADLKAADLASIIRGAIEQHDTIASRIAIGGDEIAIMPASILPLTLILNELCTNATKYGALSTAAGSVNLGWMLDADSKVLTVNWVEKGGPPVSTPRIKSLGSRLIEEAIPRQLGGRGRLMFAPSGVEFELSVPYEAVKPQIPVLSAVVS
jgi:two-component sensor histidine kinase